MQVNTCMSTSGYRVSWPREPRRRIEIRPFWRRAAICYRSVGPTWRQEQIPTCHEGRVHRDWHACIAKRSTALASDMQRARGTAACNTKLATAVLEVHFHRCRGGTHDTHEFGIELPSRHPVKHVRLALCLSNIRSRIPGFNTHTPLRSCFRSTHCAGIADIHIGKPDALPAFHLFTLR